MAYSCSAWKSGRRTTLTLILEIAAGIVLAVVVLAFWPFILAGGAIIALLVLLVAVAPDTDASRAAKLARDREQQLGSVRDATPREIACALRPTWDAIRAANPGRSISDEEAAAAYVEAVDAIAVRDIIDMARAQGVTISREMATQHYQGWLRQKGNVVKFGKRQWEVTAADGSALSQKDRRAAVLLYLKQQEGAVKATSLNPECVLDGPVVPLERNQSRQRSHPRSSWSSWAFSC